MICRVTEFDDHINQLCKEHKIHKVLHNCYSDYFGKPIQESAVPIKKVKLCESNCFTNYLSALHEIGHIVEPNAYRLFFKVYPHFGSLWSGYSFEKYILDCEAYAWEWAIKNSMFDLDDMAYDHIISCLNSYIDGCSHENLIITHPLAKAVFNERKPVYAM